MRKHVYGHILVVPLVNKSVLMNLFQRCCAWHESSTCTQPHWQSESCNGSVSYTFSWRPYFHPAKVKAVVLLSETMNDHTSQLNSIMRGESNESNVFRDVPVLVQYKTKLSPIRRQWTTSSQLPSLHIEWNVTIKSDVNRDLCNATHHSPPTKNWNIHKCTLRERNGSIEHIAHVISCNTQIDFVMLLVSFVRLCMMEIILSGSF